MSRKWKALTFGTIFFMLLVCAPLYLQAAEREAGRMPEKVPLDKLTGISLWLASLYNDERLYYSLFVTIIMGIIGLFIGYITDLILKIFGMDVSKINHHE